MDEIDWTRWEEAKERANAAFLEDMKNLAAQNKTFAGIVAQEWDGTMESVNSPKSRVRNAMMLRAVYRKVDTGEINWEEWEKDLLTSDFYTPDSGE